MQTFPLRVTCRTQRRCKHKCRTARRLASQFAILFVASLSPLKRGVICVHWGKASTKKLCKPIKYRQDQLQEVSSASVVDNATVLCSPLFDPRNQRFVSASSRLTLGALKHRNTLNPCRAYGSGDKRRLFVEEPRSPPHCRAKHRIHKRGARDNEPETSRKRTRRETANKNRRL